MALRISEIDNTSKCVIIFIKDEVRIRNRKPHQKQKGITPKRVVPFLFLYMNPRDSNPRFRVPGVNGDLAPCVKKL